MFHYAAATLIAACTVVPDLDAQRPRRQRKVYAPIQRAVVRNLEFRAMVYKGDKYGDKSFKLAEESRRLKRWIEAGDNHDRLRRAPDKVEMFGWLREDEGGPISPWLRWYPRIIRKDKHRPDRFEFALSNLHGNIIAVPLFSPDQYQQGPQTMSPQLVEFVPISMHEPYFNQNDFDPASLRIIPPRRVGDSQFRIRYAFNPKRAEDLAEWTERHLLRVAPVILDNQIVRAEVIRTTQPKQGILLAGHSLAAAQALVGRIQTRITSDTEPELSLGLRREPGELSNVSTYAAQLSDSAEASIRLVAARRLGWYGRDGSSALHTLRSAVRDQDARVAIAAIDALGAMGSDAMAAVPTLMGLRKVTHEEIAEHAKAAITSIRFNGKKRRR